MLATRSITSRYCYRNIKVDTRTTASSSSSSSCGCFLRHATRRRFFGSASAFASGQQGVPPKLSKRGRVDLLILVAGALGSWIYIQTCSDWDQDVWEAKQRLLEASSARTKTRNDHKDDFDDLPPPLQAYLQKAATERQPSSKRSSSEASLEASSSEVLQLLSVEQSGEFLASNAWYPFTATLTTTTTTTTTTSHHHRYHHQPPGFVWESHVNIFQMPNRILETLIQGHGGGSITTKAYGKAPLVQVVEEEPVILFWLAMAPLFPHVAFCQTTLTTQGREKDDQRPLIQWNAMHDLSSCSGIMLWNDDDDDNDDKKKKNVAFHLQLKFCPDTHMLLSIQVTSSSTTTCLPNGPWQVQYHDYQPFHDYNNNANVLLAPSKINIGKQGSNGKFQWHMKIANRHIQTQAPPSPSSSSA